MPPSSGASPARLIFPWRRWPLLSALTAMIGLSACRLVEYSAYAVPKGNGGDTRVASALARISMSDGPEPGFSIAVISDIQNSYDELGDAVRDINGDDSIRFVLVAGDLTQYGLLREYEWVEERLDGLRAPYLTVIGNHDALANGVDIYRKLFGPLDHSFTYRGTRFILFNDNVWQFDHPVPDLAWLDSEMAAAGSLKLVPVAHIAPSGDQIDPDLKTAMTELFGKHGTTLCIFGHSHAYSAGTEGAGGRPFVIADNIADRNWLKITFTDTAYALERVFF
jgi:3',5'-cyclic-AMP phosphodiesterase